MKQRENPVWPTDVQILHILSNVHPLHDSQISVHCKLISSLIIIHQTDYEKSGWSRAFNQFIIACELDMITAISAADIAVIMSSSMPAWLLSPLECSLQKQNG